MPTKSLTSIQKAQLARPKASYKNVGRKTAIDRLVLLKLEEAFTFSATDEESCLYSGISPTTLYEYQKKHPEFTERKQLLKKTLNLYARRVVAKDIQTNPVSAWKWLEKKLPEEFGDNRGNNNSLFPAQLEMYLNQESTTVSPKTLLLEL